MIYDWKIIKSVKEGVAESQKEKFPYFLNPKDVYGLKIQVNKHVFSPKHFKGYKFFLSKLKNIKNKTILEVGSGHGVVSCVFSLRGAKSVLAVDINKHAVKNTTLNVKYNNLKNIDVRQSDVFSNLKNSEKFDILFWNTPWAIVPKEFEKDMSPEDYWGFDVGYKAITSYLKYGKKHLADNGVLYLGFGVEGSDYDLIEKLIKKYNYKKNLIADEYFTPGEKINGKLIKFKMKLYALR